MKKILATIFTDNMVLQRNKDIKVFGKCEADMSVTVTLGELSRETVSDGNGNWSLFFPPRTACTNLTLTAKTKSDFVKCENVAIGDVWLAGGQSNMEYEIQNCTDWERVKNNRDSRIRFFYTPKLPYKNEAYYKAFDEAMWMTSDDEKFCTWSAVAYLFAERLEKDLDVPIGIIGCNWGGTSASAWMDRESILADDSTRIYIDEFDERNEGIPMDEQRAAYDTYEKNYNEWNAKCGKMYEENPDTEWDYIQQVLGPCEWPGPINNFNPFRPCGLYEQMLMRICPYTLKGVIWYQGESDDHRPRSYYILFSNMVKLWRKKWQDMLPFVIVQLPMHRYRGDNDYKNWPIIREAQLRAALNIDGVSTAIVPDCGEFNQIHPVDKGTVATRMALLALSDIYGLVDHSISYAPIFKEKKIMGSRIIIRFDSLNAELEFHGEPEAFEIAGEDKIFYPATVKLNEYTIELSSEKVSRPIYARYCWSNYCTPTLFSKNGLPVSPFRTDQDDELNTSTGSASIQQIMEV